MVDQDLEVQNCVLQDSTYLTFKCQQSPKKSCKWFRPIRFFIKVVPFKAGVKTAVSARLTKANFKIRSSKMVKVTNVMVM